MARPRSPCLCFHHDAFEVDVYSTRRLPLFRICRRRSHFGGADCSLPYFFLLVLFLCGSLSGRFQIPRTSGRAPYCRYPSYFLVLGIFVVLPYGTYLVRP